MPLEPAPRLRRWPGIAAIAIVLVVASSSFADLTPDPTYSALPCRPTIACTADFVPPGVMELESGYIYRRLGNGANQSSVPFLLKLTLLEWVQLQLGSNGPTVASAPSEARFFDDITLGLKFHLHDQTRYVPSISLSSTLSIPTFQATGYTRTYDALFTAYVTKDIGGLHADLNIGGNLWRIERAPLPQAWAALALSAPLPRHFGAMLEGYYFSSASPVNPRDGGILAALSYQPRKWVVLDAGPDLGLVQSSRVASAFVGVTLIFLDLWDTEAERKMKVSR
jgi:hypothetical protein